MPSEITASEVRELLDYDKETGIFMWKSTARGIKADRVAGCKTDVRVLIGIKRKLYKAHRLAWLYVHGVYPPDMIDHIDGNPGNNRLKNLRLATNAENGQNRKKARSDSSTGLIGVTPHKPSGLFRASIKYGGKRHSLGYYKTPEEAHQAYLKRKREAHAYNTI